MPESYLDAPELREVRITPSDGYYRGKGELQRAKGRTPPLSYEAGRRVIVAPEDAKEVAAAREAGAICDDGRREARACEEPRRVLALEREKEVRGSRVQEAPK